MSSNSSEIEHGVGQSLLVALLGKSLDQLFLLLMGIFVFFMQVGFAFLEAGSVRSKNTTNILIKNVLDVFIGGMAYWLFGYAFAYGSEGNSFIGYNYFALSYVPSSVYAHWFFQFVFAATASTIVSGAMAERTEFRSYIVYSIFLTGFIYPVVAHWAWDPKGWLYVGTHFYSIDGSTKYEVSYMDFAGSAVVHVVGGVCALVGAILVGPRIGRFDEWGRPMVIQGHTVPMAALGGFILFFGFLAFNGGSQGQISHEKDADIVSLAIVNTIISGGGGAVTAMAVKRMGFAEKKWSLLVTINGGLTGMVAVCAGANVYRPYCALVVGVLAGLTYMIWSWVVLKMKADDPVDAVAVHFGGGVWGTLAAPLLAYKTGVVYSWNLVSLMNFGWNLAGLVSIAVWSLGCSLIMFGIMRLTKQLRVAEDIEIKGLDIPKHGEPAYPQASYGDGWTYPPMFNALSPSRLNGLDIRDNQQSANGASDVNTNELQMNVMRAGVPNLGAELDNKTQNRKSCELDEKL
ncbi:putative ammonium transporter 1 [Actinia tenebrosa]|uniref:Ammonium transporter n=1 Tax=Actinia tenebrosa TaxID=6105 RepID=A0A6P8J8T4_ACTTE|nr:putative ammonium transporter 1 [Actinia tenebrosa]